MFVKPSFYDNFKCKADKCTDSCCIGWEIDIDDVSLSKYNNVNGEFGEKLKNSVVSDGECNCFKLQDDERCPFLNEKNLCEIYINLGQDSLCDICREHPRFYNYVGENEEAGLGLCCEKACEMLFDDNYSLDFISDGEKTVLDSDEEFFLDIREKIFDIIRSDGGDIFDKMNCIADFAADIDDTKNNIDFSDENFKQKVLSLFMKTEPINDEWTEYISKLNMNCSRLPKFQTDSKDYEKLLMYIIYRHFVNALYDGECYLWVLFCCVNVYFVYLCDCFTLLEQNTYSFDDRVENVKRWSKQIEYSTENIDIIKDMF